MKKVLLTVAGLVIVAGVAVVSAAPRYAESRLNRVRRAPPYRVSAAARALQSSLMIVDLHADTLLWGRAINVRSQRGHVDVPRLIDGNVAIQAFTVVTKAPRGLNIERTEEKGDMVKYLAVAEGWAALNLEQHSRSRALSGCSSEKGRCSLEQFCQSDPQQNGSRSIPAQAANRN